MLGSKFVSHRILIFVLVANGADDVMQDTWQTWSDNEVWYHLKTYGRMLLKPGKYQKNATLNMCPNSEYPNLMCGLEDKYQSYITAYSYS